MITYGSLKDLLPALEEALHTGMLRSDWHEKVKRSEMIKLNKVFNNSDGFVLQLWRNHLIFSMTAVQYVQVRCGGKVIW